MVKIIEAVISNSAQQQKLMSRTIWWLGIFLDRADRDPVVRPLAAPAVCKAVTTADPMSDLLREKHDELVEKNDHIRDITNALVDSNRIRTAMSAIISTFRSIISSR